MSPLSPNQLQLDGMDQVTTALTAALTVEDSEEATRFLGGIVDAAAHLAKVSPPSDRMKIYIEGGNTGAIKSGILRGLENVTSQADAIPERKLAAQALLDSIRADETQAE